MGCRAECAGRQRDGSWAAKHGPQCARWLIQQQAERIDVLRLLLFQRGDLGADAFDLCGGILDIEAVLHAALLSLLRDLEDVAINLQIVVRNPDLGLDTAQLNVIARQFGEARNQRIAALILSLIDLRVSRLDLSADLAPEVEFPGSVEPDIVVVDWRNLDATARSEQAAEQTDDAVLAVLLAGISASALIDGSAAAAVTPR